jgi:3-methyladenine DNA glycosylase/8-oxoguanine DNA glycosylase
LYYGGEELSEDELERFSWRWSPYRTYATVYIFTALRGGMA